MANAEVVKKADNACKWLEASAMAVAVYAARIRRSGGLSDVETTTTERSRPAGPRS